jgi:hypothetical protein
MLKSKVIAVALAGAAAVLSAAGAAWAHDEYWYAPEGVFAIAYTYTLYADAEKTQVIGTLNDTCVQSGSVVTANHPNITTPYYDETAIYTCAEMGPYLPSNWPY